MQCKYAGLVLDLPTVADDEGNVMVSGANQKAVEYLLQYGFAQSLQDAIAGRAKAVRDEYIEKIKKGEHYEPDVIAAAVAADLSAAMQKRLDAIMAGTVGTRVVGPRSESAFRKTAREMLAAYAKSKGVKLHKPDSDEYKAQYEKFVTAKKAEIEAEMKRRAEVESGIDVEIEI